MHIDKFKTEDGTYSVNGEWCENAIGVMLHYCGFCGCGSPEQVLILVRNGLALIADAGPGLLPPIPLETRKEYWREWKRKEMDIFGCYDLACFFYYWADDKGFTEHGTMVPGWLTPKGRELLEDLQELKLEEIDA